MVPDVMANGSGTKECNSSEHVWWGSNRAASGWKPFFCWECVLGWKIIHHEQRRIDEPVIYQDRQKRTDQPQHRYSSSTPF